MGINKNTINVPFLFLLDWYVNKKRKPDLTGTQSSGALQLLITILAFQIYLKKTLNNDKLFIDGGK